MTADDCGDRATLADDGTCVGLPCGPGTVEEDGRCIAERVKNQQDLAAKQQAERSAAAAAKATAAAAEAAEADAAIRAGTRTFRIRTAYGDCLEPGKKGKQPYVDDENGLDSESRWGMHCSNQSAVFRLAPLEGGGFRIYTACEASPDRNDCRFLTEERCLRRDGDDVVTSSTQCDDSASVFSQPGGQGTAISTDDGRCLRMEDVGSTDGRRLRVGGDAAAFCGFSDADAQTADKTTLFSFS